MWTRIEELPPPYNIIVETQDCQGNIRQLFKRGNGWYNREGNQVYSPTYWRYLK